MDYQRQRQMTLGDLLLENRIVFPAGRDLRRQRQRTGDEAAVLAERESPQGHSLLHQLARWKCDATLAIYDTMQIISCPVNRLTASDSPPAAGPSCWPGGTKGKRYALPHSKRHDPPTASAASAVQVSDIEIQRNEIIKTAKC